MPVVELEKQGQVAIVTLSRPEKRNAMSPEVIVRLQDAWREVRDSDNIRVAVLTGAEKIAANGPGPAFPTRDAVEGLRPFMEKRKPIWEGR